ncbi:hypothetical protein HDU86_006678 [Geranomyces michiganensis]|nr:hypothetical protein HDU86_006678 [Geranomyces michiganensis]
MDSQSSGVLRNGETHFRQYLIDTLIADFQVLQRHNWISNQSFDTLLQYLQFEKTAPSAAFNGVSPSAAGSGVPFGSAIENKGSDVQFGILTFKSYNTKRLNTTDIRVKDASAQPSAVEAAAPPQHFLSQQHQQLNPPARLQLTAAPTRILIAISEFASDEDGDLSLAIGDEIELLEEVDANWYRGRTAQGAEGIFPKSFVKDLRSFSTAPPPLPRR